MNAVDLIRMGHKPDLQTQLHWARCQRGRDPLERLALFELVSLANGTKRIKCSASLLGSFMHVSTSRAAHVLGRLEANGCLRQFCDAEGEMVIELDFPPTRDQIDPQGAHVRAREDG